MLCRSLLLLIWRQKRTMFLFLVIWAVYIVTLTWKHQWNIAYEDFRGTQSVVNETDATTNAAVSSLTRSISKKTKTTIKINGSIISTTIVLKSTLKPDMLHDANDIKQMFECHLPAASGQTDLSAKKKLPICDCFPKGLESYKPFSDTAAAKENLSMDFLSKKYESMSEGSWSPSNCVARHKVAIIIPYRDRESHLLQLLNVLIRLLQKQNADFTFVVSEQGSPQVFNKAKLMNAAYVEAKKLGNFSCYFFHDVDLIPEDERILYTCPSTVRYQGTAIDKANYKQFWDKFIGGVSVFTPEVYEKIDGHSNLFWGWGGEDDNIYRRVLKKDIKLITLPLTLAKYHMVKHEHDKDNPITNIRFKYMSELSGGLSTLQQKLVKFEKKKLFVWIVFDISEPSQTTTVKVVTKT